MKVKDSRADSDFQFGFGLHLNYRVIRTSPFSLGGVLSLPFDWHSTTDDGNKVDDIESHTVYLTVCSPRVGIQSEIMVSPSLDIIIRGEYVLTSINLDNKWTYSDDDSTSLPANWDLNEGPEPKIDYSGFQFSIGLRSIFFN